MKNNHEIDERTENRSLSSDKRSIGPENIGRVDTPGKLFDYLKKGINQTEGTEDLAKQEAQAGKVQNQMSGSLSEKYASAALDKASDNKLPGDLRAGSGSGESSVIQLHQESELRTKGQTDNLLTTPLKPENLKPEDSNSVKLSPGLTAHELKFSIKQPLHDGQNITFAQSIDYQFKPITPEQKQWQQEHPNGSELGHIVHVHFRAKSTNDNKMTVRLMDSNPPYDESMSQRVDLSNKGHKDSDGYTTYDFYGVAPDSKNAGKLNLKFNLGREQQPGDIDIKDLRVQEVSSAPGLNPSDVVKAAGNQPDAQRHSDHSFSFYGTGANQLSWHNVAIPPETMTQIHRDYPYMPHTQQKEIEKYQQEHALKPDEQEKYLKRMKEMGITCVTIPIYWDQIEKLPGKMDYSSVDHMIELAKKEGLQVKLHPIVWQYCYPKWADKTAGTGDAPPESSEQHTESMIKKHIDDVIQHFGNKVDFIEVNEINTTDLSQQAKWDDASGTKHTQQFHNGLTDWVQKAGPAAVINQVDQWVRDDLAKYKSHAKLFGNEYVADQKTLANDAQISQDPNRPDALGIQMHQFNGNAPALRLAQEIDARAHNGLPAYISEYTVQTNYTGPVDEATLSPEVRQAVEQRNKELPPLSEEERHKQEIQAEQLLLMYKLAASNPNVIGVSGWDFTDKNAWMQGTGGVLDANLDPKVSYLSYSNLSRIIRLNIESS